MEGDDATAVVASGAPAGPPITLLCRLLAGPAAAGRFIGHVELVETGERFAVTDLADLARLLARIAADR